MSTTRKNLLMLRMLCALSVFAMAAGCTTLTQKPVDVGAVVVAPKPQPPAVPVKVQALQPKPAGYFLCSFLTYSTGSCVKPTK